MDLRLAALQQIIAHNQLLQTLRSEVLQQNSQTGHKEYLLPYLRSCTLSQDMTDADVPLTRLLLVESVRVDRADFSSLKSASFWRRMPLLTKFHQRTNFQDKQLLPVVAAIHPKLRTLDINGFRSITQAMIEPFTSLEELDITYCKNITNVHFCSSTLRRLYAIYSGLTDAGLSQAVHLEVLHVGSVKGVTTVAPFAASLYELDATIGCGIDDKGLAMATNIRILRINGNENITTFEPFAASLRELSARGEKCKIGDSALAMATGIVRLYVSENPNVTTVEPFAASLRELLAYGEECGVHDSGLSMATGIIMLDAENNQNITTVAPFAASLRHLSATGCCGIDTQGLSTASGLVELLVWYNIKVHTLSQCVVKSLCRLAASKSGINNELRSLANYKELLSLPVFSYLLDQEAQRW